MKLTSSRGSSTRRCGCSRRSPRSGCRRTTDDGHRRPVPRSRPGRRSACCCARCTPHPSAWPRPGGRSTSTGGCPSEGRPPPARVQAVRQRRTGLHRPAVRAHRSPARARAGSAELRAVRPGRLPAADQADADHQTATTSPLRVRPRQAHERITVRPAAPVARTPPRPSCGPSGSRMTVAYGSNLGTSEDLAQQLADRAGRSGFAVTLQTLDELSTSLPTEGLLVAVTSSYNGKAPDNAQHFDALCEPAGALTGVRFAVLGNGNTQWATYQAFPSGSRPRSPRRAPPPSCPGARPTPPVTSTGWPRLVGRPVDGARPGVRRDRRAPDRRPVHRARCSTTPGTAPSVVSAQAYPITVVGVDELVGDPSGLWDYTPRERRGPASSRSPSGCPRVSTTPTGNHLAVFAKNDPELVAWALHTLRIPSDRVVRLGQDGDRRTHLPIGVPVTAELLLTEFVELQETATRGQLGTLRSSTPDARGPPGSSSSSTRGYPDEVLAKRISVLSAAGALPGDRAAARCVPGHGRGDPAPVLLDLVVAAGRAGPPPAHRRPRRRSRRGPVPAAYRGMCSQYLARLRPGDTFYGYVRVPSPPFQPPAATATPMILVGPGTGFAPLRGFLQERALHRRRACPGVRRLPPPRPRLAVPRRDAAVGPRRRRRGAHRVLRAAPVIHTGTYRIRSPPRRDRVWELLEAGAHVYVCGDGARMAPAVRAAIADDLPEPDRRGPRPTGWTGSTPTAATSRTSSPDSCSGVACSSGAAWRVVRRPAPSRRRGRRCRPGRGCRPGCPGWTGRRWCSCSPTRSGGCWSGAGARDWRVADPFGRARKGS